MQQIMYQNKHICYLEQHEVLAFGKLAPFWGLLYQKQQSKIYAGLSSRKVKFVNMNKREMEHLESLLTHTGVQFIEDNDDYHLLLEVHLKSDRQLTPITLNANNIKYHLKYTNNYQLNLERSIHKNIWLPVQAPILSLAFNNLTFEKQSEVMAYLIIQFFLRKQMKSISHISFDLYATLSEKVMRQINPNFFLQNNIHKSSSPDIHSAAQSSSTKRELFSKQNSTTINPFKRHSSAPQKVINPFQSINSKPSSSKINPFKRKK